MILFINLWYVVIYHSESPESKYSRFHAHPRLLVLFTRQHGRTMSAASCNLWVPLRCCVRKLENQDIVRLLIGLAVPLLAGFFGAWCLSVQLEHVLAAVHDVACRSVLDGLQSVDIRRTPIRNG